MAGQYKLKQRAASQEQTRQRIVEAAVELHQALGPSATTVSDIARRAGVGRVTVYRHFADEAEILGACSGLYFQRHPPPDPESWRAIEDPVERLRIGLAEAYAYHRETEAMITPVLADIPEHEVVQPYHELWSRASDVLLEPWRARGRRRTLLRAGIALALSFHTWRQLIREQELSDEQAIELAMRLVGGEIAEATRDPL
ncbi:MAG: helix-turn-helix domain-containing protein [Solirubrobacterales bacterium]